MALAQPDSDIAALWDEALTVYEGVTKINLRTQTTKQRTVESIKKDQERQLEQFAAFRHDKGKLDRFRTMINRNADIVQGVSNNVACAASLAFPPSSVILTAFTLVLTASKHVSDDYDLIEGFFRMMQSFLQRLSLLENMIPRERNFQICLINVFSSLLKLSAIAQTYRKSNRFSKWAKALVEMDGKDPVLKDAYESLHGNLAELESAMIMKTLRNTIEISEEAKSSDQNIKALRGQVDRNISMTIQTREYAKQNLNVNQSVDFRVGQLLASSYESAVADTELLRISNTVLRKIDSMETNKDKVKQQSMKSGASRPVNFERLRPLLKTQAMGGLSDKMNDMELSKIDSLFDWIDADPAFQNVINNEDKLLHVSGTSGMGKTTLSFRMFHYLEELYIHESTTCVAWFPFDEEHPEMHSIQDMLRCCASKVAKKDNSYCTGLLRKLKDGDFDTDEDAYICLVESMYTKNSGRRLILVLDGIDQLSLEDLHSLVVIFGRMKSQSSCIQVIFTCDLEKMQHLSALEAQCIDLNHDKIARDLRKFTESKTKTLPRLRKLRKRFRKTITNKVMQKADSFLYIDHTMRRLNAIAYEGLISKELDKLSENTTAIYHTLFEECQKSRTPEDKELLRNLLAWLAYGKGKLTVADANVLLEVIRRENSISIEEELDGRLARLLRVSGERRELEQEESSEDEDKAGVLSEDDQDIEQKAEDANNFLSFQHRSLKAYFRQAIQDRPDGLRCTPTEAHAMIFRTSSYVLTMTRRDQNTTAANLVQYAAGWGLSHLLAINPEDNDAVSDNLARAIIEGLYDIFTNKNDSLKPMERRYNGLSTVLSSKDVTQENALTTLSAWARRATQLSPSSLPYGVLDWLRPFIQQPQRIFIGLARAHINNWFSARTGYDASCSFKQAHAALAEGRDLPQLKQNQAMNGYFKGSLEDRVEYTEESFNVVADCFWDIVKTSSSYKGIGMSMKQERLYRQAIVQFDKGLQEVPKSGQEQHALLVSKGEALMKLGIQEGQDVRTELLEQSLAILEEANKLYREIHGANQDEDELRRLASVSFGNTARVAAHLGRPDIVLSSMSEGKETQFDLNFEILTDIISTLKDTSHWSIMMEVLKGASPSERTWYLMFERLEAVHEASIRSKQGHYMLDIYNEALRGLAGPRWRFIPHEYTAFLQLKVAAYAREALNDHEMAKSLLRQIIHDPRTNGWLVLQGCNQLVGLLFEQLRLNNVPQTKLDALDEAIKLLDKPTEAMLEGYNPAESHIITTVALMLQRLGPAIDMSDRLHAAFENCIGELKDDTGMNDRSALRRLARLLSCLVGFEKEASICLTAQCYVLDDAVRRKDLENSQDPSEDTGNTNEQADAELDRDGPVPMNSIDAVINDYVSQELPTDESITGSNAGPQSTEAGRASPESALDSSQSTSKLLPEATTTSDEDPSAEIRTEYVEMAEGLIQDTQPYCNYCGEDIGTWSHGNAYLCVYCIDVDICEKCFSKRLAREKGELEPDWRTICPTGHRHVKAPIEGWRGVKEGRLRIDAEEIPFRTWLGQLEIKWAKYWDDFWTESEAK